MPNKSSGGKSGGGQSQQWRLPQHYQMPQAAMAPRSGYAMTNGTMGTQTVTAQPPAGQLPAMGNQPAAQMPQAPVMPTPQAPDQQIDLHQRFNGLNPFTQWLFAQNASRRGITPFQMYENFWNRKHGL